MKFPICILIHVLLVGQFKMMTTIELYDEDEGARAVTPETVEKTTHLDFNQAMEDFRVMFPEMDPEVIEVCSIIITTSLLFVFNSDLILFDRMFFAATKGPWTPPSINCWCWPWKKKSSKRLRKNPS